MSKSLLEYAAWLDDQKLLWPAAPKVTPAKAAPALKPLAGIKAVTWGVYGTLISIADGRLAHQHPQQIRMQVALEKTIEQFNMWNSMSRKPGAPWEYMLTQYNNLVEERRLSGSPKPGELSEINSADVWRKIVERLGKKEYQYNEEFFGDVPELGEKIAYFFHSMLQGVSAAPQALDALRAVTKAGLKQGLIGDGQCFTFVQLLRSLQKQGPVASLTELVTPGCMVFSFQTSTRQPSKLLLETALKQFEAEDVSPGEILHVASHHRDELAVAKSFGLRTALYAGDKASLQCDSADLQDPALRPDRLLTELGQIRQILGVV
jgi:FMN phosphatase YigB (HAD superfamily)